MSKGPSTGSASDRSVGATDGVDRTLHHAWSHEYLDSDNPNAIVSPEGLENIASHQYRPGTYTYLDNVLNPFWLALTNCLPMWMAPNMVTTLGGLHCALSYGVLWKHSYNFDSDVPSWVLILSGYCTAAYYTLDCMDGKQARRTGTSSPLGQLFDHGFDCICNLSHLGNIAAITMVGELPNWYFGLQGSLQFSFFMAQWEEYYTGVLPHAQGNVGVTEVNYGIALMTFLNAFVDREAVWKQSMANALPAFVTSQLEHLLGVGDDGSDSTALSTSVSTLLNMELRQFIFASWFLMITVLVLSSFLRVFKHLHYHPTRCLSACSKLLSPAVVAATPYILPFQYRAEHIRKISVASGLLMSLLTKKIIVFSMAKMSFASLQRVALPYVVACVWIHRDGNITPTGVRTALRFLCVYHAVRLLRWAHVVIDQICIKLDIYCFTIKNKTKSKDGGDANKKKGE